MHISGISIAEAKGSPRKNLEQAQITPIGLFGDRHAGSGTRQVTLMGEATARAFAEAVGQAFAPGLAKENLLITGLEDCRLHAMDCLRVGHAELEITRLGKLFSASGESLCPPNSECGISDYGVFARVAHPGFIQVGDAVTHTSRTLRALVLTLSDRASSGGYEDLSGTRAVNMIEAFGVEHRWRVQAERRVLPDDAELLESALVQARESALDLVVTTGGTGIGPRDITAQVVTDHADRLIPGVMEHVRLKYGQERPLALLSASVAAIFGRTLVFALPGSPRAVEEYLVEILPLLEHIILVTRGLEAH
ncbi:MAG: molybdenum cofactor synthesis protein [Candidatus Hydrogenedentes bacterium]|nr:molybdenum cofactor synthesis protein [Candidatus Hydrogenedentota bacterium]